MTSFDTFLTGVCDRYQAMFSAQGPQYDQVFVEIAQPVLSQLAAGDAPYHTVAHTLQVIKVGQAILEGKQFHEGSVSPRDWLHMLVALLCHDIGYVKGVCQGDRPAHHCYANGAGGYVHLPPHATGATLSEHHVARSQAYVATYLAHCPWLDTAAIQWNIEMTRFPVPDNERYRDTCSYAGLCRAADLLGQLGDPQYMQKLSALFDEFEETGTNQTLGYKTPTDLRASYPHFYRHIVHPYIQRSLYYLGATSVGPKLISQLYTNICLAKMAQPQTDKTSLRLKKLHSEAELLPWQEAGFIFT
ncbi:MAG: metal-dependent phosphohydrolase [Cyanobacteria bacterium P01_D01_bin.56]